MLLLSILLSTLAAGIGSVWLAALTLRWGLGRRDAGARTLLSLAAGALLGTAFMHLLPEAFEDAGAAGHLFPVLLASILLFFLLDKAELWHHGHEHGVHGTQAAPVAPSGAGAPPAAGGWAVLAGDGLHCFGDGVLIASAFYADAWLGTLTALAVLAHEVPHHIGDLVVLQGAGAVRARAALKLSVAGGTTVLGGLAGYLLLGQLHGMLPYLLVVASGSFVYVALADLVPQLQQRLTARQTAVQVAWLLAGIAVVTAFSALEPAEAPVPVAVGGDALAVAAPAGAR